jgi:hypothetical protein
MNFVSLSIRSFEAADGFKISCSNRINSQKGP